MTTPVTTLDQRYSGESATAVTWEQTRELIEATELFWLCTVRPDGRPPRDTGCSRVGRTVRE
jgi:hypothetical protein